MLEFDVFAARSQLSCAIAFGQSGSIIGSNKRFSAKFLAALDHCKQIAALDKGLKEGS